MLTSLTAPAALALGEKGPFDLPLSRDTITVAPGVVNRIPLTSLLDDDAESELNLDSVRLAVPSDASDAQLSEMTLASDGTSLAVEGEGTWTIQGEELVFTPASESETDPAPIALTIEATNGIRSLPSDLPVEPSPVADAGIAAPAGGEIRVSLKGDLRPSGTERVRLLLDTMPAGSTLSGDGRRLIAVGEGEWQVSEDATELTFTPSSSHLGRSPEPMRYVAESADGTVLTTGIISLTTPVLPDLVRAAPFGDPIDFDVADGQEDVESSTLRLVPLTHADAGSTGASDGGSDGTGSTDAGSEHGATGTDGDAATGTDGDPTTSGSADDGVKVNSAGTRAVVAGQGTWTLDRKKQSVRFTPAEDSVKAADPIGLTGEDSEGNTAGVATLAPGYPAMLDQTQVGTAGTSITFAPMDDARFVRADSLRFAKDGLPSGAKVSSNGRELTIPGQGSWAIDVDARAVTFDPDDDAENGLRSTVQLVGSGSYADSTSSSATLTALVTDSGAVLRDDELRTAPGKAVQVDLLANDTAGAPSDPLSPATVRISSLEASNLDDLERYSGTHLVVPGEGEYQVGSDGVLRFTPARGFRGRTTSISYTVQDAEGVQYRANVSVQVDPQLASASDPRGDSSAGINTMLSGLMPSATSTSAVFLTIVVLMGFAGVISLFIGARMESDRRTWKD
ncbi:Ig-like domain-containing protein [Brachybacterium kimchii]|uniref:Ig-like domain-containing protein n=1 Tax=Brachybacterium kimchii TaxID=2942909 RepID=A0ABY4N0G7_9MICO|nr:Ig-like domain-containing protein [Brachybacterium kimchii]UQN28050.1 Ig-like domain-containing protein [Brachybacterium kimchii]